MRRILVDNLTVGSMLETRPDADQLTMKIPEPNASNVGPTAFQGVAEYVRSDQEIDIEVEQSGIYLEGNTEGYQDDGSRYKLKLATQQDSAGDDIIDVANWMGSAREYDPCFLFMAHMDYAGDNERLSSMKIKKLEYWKDADPDYGYIGFMAGMRRDTATDNVFFDSWRLKVSKGELEWELIVAAPGAPSRDQVSEATMDFIEMSDGTLVMVYSSPDLTGGDCEIYHSYDCGDTWHLMVDRSLSLFPAGTIFLGLERIGDRLVVVGGYESGGNWYLKSTYSDDYGMTWDATGTTIENGGNAVNAWPFVQLIRGSDGKVRVLYGQEDAGANDSLWIEETSNGITWTTVYNSEGLDYFHGCLVEDYDRKWILYTVNSGGEIDRRLPDDILETWPTGGHTLKGVLEEADDSDGVNAREIYACSLNDGAFIDLTVAYIDTHSGTFYANGVFRCSAWSGITLSDSAEGSNNQIFDTCWFPHCYPSTADAHPNMNHWDRTKAAAASMTLNAGEGGYIIFDPTLVTQNAYYSYGSMPTETWDTGIMCRTVVKMDSATANDSIFEIYCRLCSNGSNKDVAWQLQLIWPGADPGGFFLVDVHAGTVADEYIVPSTDLKLSEWNEFLIIAKENEVYIYRAPFSPDGSGLAEFVEIRNYELVLSSTTLQEDAYTSDLDELSWGIFNDDPAGEQIEATEPCYVKCFFANVSGTSDDGWNFATDIRGRRCSIQPNGLLQGISCKWGGHHAVDGDAWDLDTGALYEADNLFIHSPSIRWQEPEQDGSESPSRVFEWERPVDSDGDDMKFGFNAFALFGRNFLNFKLEGLNAGGGGDTTLFDTGALAQGSDRAWIGYVNASSTDDNILTISTVGDGPIAFPMIPNQFASTPGRNFYIYIYIPSAARNKIFKILGNNETQLFLERNYDDYLGLGPENSYIFSDRVFFEFGSMQAYARLKLTVYAVTTSPSEDQLRLGTFLLGRTYNLADDDWESSIISRHNLNTLVGRSGIRHVRRQGNPLRTIQLKYVGQTDMGMGTSPIHELFRFGGGGEYPIAWLDDDTVLDSSENYVHSDPILARMMGPATQTRRSYNNLVQAESSNVDPFIRNIWEVGGLALEEII